MECPTDVLRFTDPKVGNALRSLDFMADADNMPAAEAKPVAIVISITIKLVGASKPATAGKRLLDLYVMFAGSYFFSMRFNVI